jgi:prolyl 4-hydroxylase
MTIDLSSMLERHVVFTEGKLDAFKECATYVKAMGSEAFTKQPEMSVAMRMQIPDMVLFSNFLTPAECDELIEQAKTRLARSKTFDSNTGKPVENPVRTSYGMFFRRGETPLIDYIEQKISAITGVPVDHGEGIQVLRYEVGQEYKPHHDYFDTTREGYKDVDGGAGQRIATFMMYLNTPEKGGGTSFPESKILVEAIKGNGLLFRYPTTNKESKSLHGGTPVQAGVKWAATKWLRERPYIRPDYQSTKEKK